MENVRTYKGFNKFDPSFPLKRGQEDEFQGIYLKKQMKVVINLIPRSLVDEAEGEIWQSKKICFS